MDNLFERFSSLIKLILSEFGEESYESFFGSFLVFEDVVDNLLGKVVIFFEKAFFLNWLLKFSFTHILNFFNVLLIWMWENHHEAFSVIFSFFEAKDCSETIESVFDGDKCRFLDCILIETKDKLDRLEFFKEVHEDKMFLGDGLNIFVIYKVDERFIETNHEGPFLIDVCFDVGDPKGLEIVAGRGVKGEELFRDGALICKDKTNNIGMVGEDRNKLDEFFNGSVAGINYGCRVVIRWLFGVGDGDFDLFRVGVTHWQSIKYLLSSLFL